MNKKKLDPESQAAMDIVAREKLDEEKRKKDLIDVSKLGILVGELFTHKGYRLLATCMEGKKLLEIQENRDYLKIPGVMNFEQYLDSIGYSKATAWRDMRIAKAFTPEDVSTLKRLRPSRRDLLSLTNIPEKDLRSILDHGYTTDEELRDALDQALIDNKKLKDEHTADKRITDRLLKSKQDLIDRKEHDLLDLEEKVRDLQGRIEGKFKIAGLSEEDQETTRFLATCQMNFLDIMISIRKKIDLAKAPQPIINQLFFLYIFMASWAQDERVKLLKYDDGSQPETWELDEEDIPPPEMMIPNMPLTAACGDAYKRWLDKRMKEKAIKRGEKGNEGERKYS